MIICFTLQFSSLASNTHIPGLDAFVRVFTEIVDDICRKPYDLLDTSRNIFDRDFMEFNVNIADLENDLQVGYSILQLDFVLNYILYLHI
jgi:dynein heavy chain, axonemal